MSSIQTYKLSVAAIAASLILAACGGGGGGGGGNASAPGGASAPAGASSPAGSSTGVAPQTSVPEPTYAAGTFQAAAFAEVNSYRNAMGVGELAQDPILDDSAQRHSLYMWTNLSTGVITALPHNEIAGNADFYAETPLLRAQKSGAPTTEFIGENIAAALSAPTPAVDAADCVGQALASVYHLADLTGNQETMGLGYIAGNPTYLNYVCTSDFGTSTGVTNAPGPNQGSLHGGQQIPVGTVVHSPFSSETGVALAMRPESDNPAADLPAPGRPVLVRVNAANGETLNVSQFTLTDSTGAPVAARILVPAAATGGSTATTVADPNNLLPAGVAVLLPLVPLKANAAYTVSFSGARAGSQLTQITWTFTTAPN